MQQSQRAESNHALEYAIARANELVRPVLVVFCVMLNYPEANLRHYSFMLEGLKETRETLRSRGIQMAIMKGEPVREVVEIAREAALLVTDVGYLRHQRRWRAEVASLAELEVTQVESDVVIPVEKVSHKAEYAARMLRSKMKPLLDSYLLPLSRLQPRKDSLSLRMESADLDSSTFLAGPSRVREVPPVSVFKGGAAEAKRLLNQFVNEKLRDYETNRSHPELDGVSRLSPYLHFGQISPVDIARQVSDAPGVSLASKEAFLDELVVRRELACNFVHFTPGYDDFASLPGWARLTLHRRQKDPRPYVYDETALEKASTHDPYWNAAMLEMKHTGYMHNYMRMYWGKKILEWSENPETAYYTALRLNNRYLLDGRDPSSYGNIGWIFGLHDRPWFERPIFGTVRYMSAGGLKRKTNIDAYVKRMERLIDQQIGQQ